LYADAGQPDLNILYLILVLLIVTRVFAELAERLGIPAIVGELVAGVALGLVLQTFHESWPVLWSATQSETFESIVNLGMFFLMLLAGIRMEPLEFARTSRTAIFVALGGMVVPVAAGIGFGLLVLPESPLKTVQSLFLGTALAITAVPVAVRMFLELDLLESRIGKTVIAAALWDDLISLFLLAFLISALNGNSFFEVGATLQLAGKVLLFFAITIPVGLFVFPVVSKYFRYLRFPEVDFSMFLIAGLAYALFAEKMGMHFIIGAFLAGMFFHPRSVEQEVYDRVEKQMSGITRGFLAPIFFVSVGLHLDFGALASIPGFVTVLILLALASKFVGAGLPAYAVGLSTRESLMVGVGMSGRGAVELIVAGVALDAGLFLMPSPPPPVIHGMYSSIVIMALVTTIIAPAVLRVLADRTDPG
jgi:Kef-type K+ transport system membrane component KefB